MNNFDTIDDSLSVEYLLERLNAIRGDGDIASTSAGDFSGSLRFGDFDPSLLLLDAEVVDDELPGFDFIVNQGCVINRPFVDMEELEEYVAECKRAKLALSRKENRRNRRRLFRQQQRAARSKIGLQQPALVQVGEYEVPRYPVAAPLAFKPQNPSEKLMYQERYRMRSKMRRHLTWLRAEYARFVAKERREISLQSGKELPPRASREDRDIAQRTAAVKRITQAYKSIPKAQRLKDISVSRDKRNPALAEMQSGLQGALRTAGTAVMGGGVALLLGKIWRLIGKSDAIVGSVASFMKHLREIAAALKKHLGPILWSVPLIVTIYYALRHFKVLGNPVSHIITSALGTLVGIQLWAKVSAYFQSGDQGDTDVHDSPSVDKVEMQSGGVDTFSKLLATAFTFSIFGKKFSHNTVTELIRRMAMLDRATAGWNTFLDWLMTAFEACYNYVRSAFGKNRVELFKRHRTVVQAWARSIEQVLKDDNTGVPVDQDRLDTMVNLVKQGYDLKEIYRTSNMARTVDDALAKIVTALMPYQGAISARNNFRMEPVATVLLGGPGIGKTLLATHFCATVMLLGGLMPEGSSLDDIAKNIFQKGNSEYWNGYANPATLVIDDIFQKRANLADEENDYMNIIRMVSGWAFPLNFADLASKGKIYFGSKVIYGTTNLKCIASEASQVIQDPEAVTRRIQFAYALRVKQEYKDGERLDYNAFVRELGETRRAHKGIDSFPWYMWEVAKHDFLHGSTAMDWRPLKELVVEISMEVKRRSQDYQNSRVHLEEYISSFNVTEAAHPPLEEIVVTNQSGLGSVIQVGSALGCGICVGKLCEMLVQDAQAAYKELMSNSRIVDKLLNGLKYVGGFALGFIVTRAILQGVFGIIGGFFNKEPRGFPKPQSNRPLSGHRGRVKFTDVRLQSGASNPIVAKLYDCSYKMYMCRRDTYERVIGQIQFLCSDLAVMPFHFTSDIKNMLMLGECVDTDMLVLRKASNPKVEIKLSVAKFLGLRRHSFEDRDVEFLRFELHYAHKRCIQNFINETDVQYVHGKMGRIDVCEVDDSQRILPDNKRYVWLPKSLKYGMNLRAESRIVERYFHYDAGTKKGDCGAVVALFDSANFNGRTAVGLHIAGCERLGRGFCNIVTQEMCNKAMEVLCVIEDRALETLADAGIELQAGLPFMEDMGSFSYIGSIDRTLPLPVKSKLFPTRYYGVLGEHDGQPAVLSKTWRDGEVIYPMLKALEPYKTPVLTYEQPWLKQAMHVALKPTFELTRDAPRMIFDFKTACMGDPRIKFRGLPRGTSAGFICGKTVKNGKKEFFGFDEQFSFDSDLCKWLEEEVERITEDAANGIRRGHFYIDFMKDELRKLKKVVLVETRAIACPPLPYTITWRKHFGAFMAAVMSVHTKSGMAPGICTFTDWDFLGEFLSQKGDKCFDGDFKAFDSSEQPCILNLILEMVNNWYDDGPRNKRIREVLWMDLVHSRHIGGNGYDQRHIYQWNKSLPSGHPFTTIVNSIYSLFMLVGAYTSITGDLTGFWDHVAAVTYGDDNNVNVTDAVSAVYNQRTVSEALKKEFGMTYTAGNKSGELVETMPLTETTFLKRGFALRDNHWLCPLELGSFLYSFYWCKNKRLEEKIIDDELENSLQELSMHSPEVWAQYSKPVAALLLERGHITKVLCEQDQYLAVVRTRKDEWY